MSGETVFLAGAGLMGTDIALLFASHGYKVILFDISETSLERARKRHLSLTRNKEFTEINPDTIENIQYTTEIHNSEDADFVFEAVVEDLYIKRRLFHDIEKYVGEDTVFATNTSSYKVSEIASHMENKERLASMHFSNPPLVMKLLEVVGGPETDDSVIDQIIDTGMAIGKKPILLDKECRGLVLNRLLYVAFVDALIRLSSGAKPEDLDSGIKNLGVPYGVVEAMDLIGLDTVKRILDNLREAYGDRYNYPSALLEEKIRVGWLGKKSGRGFYEWKADHAIVPEGEPLDPTRTVAVVINEAYRLVEEGVADKSRIDDIYILGVNSPVGLFEVAQLFGEENLIDILNNLYNETQHKVYKWYKPFHR